AVLYIPVTFFTLTTSPFLFEKLSQNMLFYLALIPLLVSIPCVPAALTGRRYGRAFVASAATIASMIAMAGISLYPMLVPSRLYPSFSLTIYNASSTPLTLKVMFIIAAVGVPVMLVYTAYVYRVFRGTVRHSDEGY
ncbi:MAG TPA: cytochrome d ubiquinol oxidase subunit II, partial [Candidatus Hydrogenedentes bacterium]|nr:cytochrome d ubiquinol oxidase subunit II [Candidatus Hydrogenedentota bacterium]